MDLSSGGARRLLLPGSAPVLETGLVEHGPRSPAVPTGLVQRQQPFLLGRVPCARRRAVAELAFMAKAARRDGVRGCQGPSVRLGVHTTH